MRSEVRQGMVLSVGAAFLIAGSMAMVAYGAPINPALSQEASGQPPLQMVMARAELKDGINAKKAKQGDAVRARLTERVKLADGHELERDSILEGHLDQVQPSENKGDSTVVATFDKVMVKGGEELPIKATLLKIWEPQQGVSGGMSPQAAMPQGGGPMQSGVSVSGTPETAHIPMSMNVPGAGMPQGAQPIRGVTLHSDLHEKSSATFTSSRRNVDVPSGTMMQFEMVVIPAGAHLQ